MNRQSSEKLYTLKEASEQLSVSYATCKNWLRLGKLTPSVLHHTTPLFSESDLIQISNSFSSDDTNLLKRRRNKSHITGNMLYRNYVSSDSVNKKNVQYLIVRLSDIQTKLTDLLLLCLLRDCAEKLLTKACVPVSCTSFLDELVTQSEYTMLRRKFPILFTADYTYIASEDTLGYLYLSLCNLNDRKSSGSYYTPVWLAKHAVTDHISPTPEQTVLDPSCGTGMFLLQLPDTHPLCNLYGCDLNPVSTTLTRLNLAIKYKISDEAGLNILRRNIKTMNYLEASDSFPVSSFDIILGNPPWGAVFSVSEKKEFQQRFLCAHRTAAESFDLFLEQSILHYLSDSGVLSFILPEAILNVKSHSAIRALLLEHTTLLSLEYLGEVFEGVHCPSILITLRKAVTGNFCLHAKISDKANTFIIRTKRAVSAEGFSFAMSDEEYTCLSKLMHAPNCTTLKGQADFALGIVTGDNQTLLHTKPLPNTEPIIKGTDISKYHIHSYSGYVRFAPETFQQSAPEEFYRAKEKLFYRFINKQLIFAYDDTGLLSLNSCNIVIPRIDGLSAKYVMAVLNSKLVQFIFEKQFRSVKVLRSHLEQIPIPYADKETQAEIEVLVDRLMESEEESQEYQQTYQILECKIEGLYDSSGK